MGTGRAMSEGAAMHPVRAVRRFGRTAWTLAAWAIAAMWIVAFAGDDSSTSGPAQPAPAEAARLEMGIRDVLWQELPRAVRQAVLAPDGRVWYVLASAPESGTPGPVDAAVVRRAIEREFRKVDPQVTDAVPALFEASGRVWFITTDGTKLLGYDGKA